MTTLFKIFAKATAILLLWATASLAQTADKPIHSDSTDIKVLEERLKQQEKNNETNLEAIRNEIEYRDSARKSETELRAKELEKRIDLYFWGGSLVLVFIVFLLRFLGAKTMVNWIKDKISEKVNEITERELEKTWGGIFQKFAEQKTEEYESTLTERLNKLEKEREEYLRLKNDLLEMKDTFAMKEPSPEQPFEKYEQFEKMLKSIKREDQYTSHDWLIRASSEYYKGNYEETIEYLNKSIDKDPKSAMAYSNRGIIYYYLREHEKGIEDYNKAIELDPNYARAYYNRGCIYTELKEYEKALADYDKSIELDPKGASAYNNRGNTYSKLKEYEKALADYDKSIELDANYAMPYNNRASTYSKLKEYERALADYDKAIELDPNYADAYANRGATYFGLEEYEKALADYDKAIELAPNKAQAHNNRAITYHKLKEYEKALGDYDKAIEVDPGYISAYENIAELLIFMGNYDMAIGKIGKAMIKSVEAKEKAVLLYLKCIAQKLLRRDTTEAETELEEILKEDIGLTWDFDQIEEWMIAADIPAEARKFIEEKTEMLRKKMK